MIRESVTYQLAALAEDAIRPAKVLFERRVGLNVHELRVLRLIDDEPGVTFTRLAMTTAFDRSATSRILSKLVKSGFVRREIDESDARHFRLHATAKGRAIRQKADPLSIDLEKLTFSVLSETEQAAFRAMLEKTAAWLAGDFVTEMIRRYPDAVDARRRKRSFPGTLQERA